MPTAPSNFVHTLAADGTPRRSVERRIAQLALGIVAALRDGRMTADQARADLFNTDNYLEAKRLGVSAPLLELIVWGMELEDVADLAPAGLPESYGHIASLASRILSS